MNILKFEIKKFLELLFHLLNLIIFLFNCLFTFCLYVFHILPQPVDLLIFLLPNFLHSIFYNVLYVLFLINYFPKASYLKLVFLLFVAKLSFRTLNLSFDFKSLFIFNFQDNLHFRLLSFFCSLFPSVKFVLYLKEFRLPIGGFGLLIFNIQLNLLDFRFCLCELFVFIIKISLKGAELFKEKLIFELKVFCPSKSDSKFTKLLMHIIIIILKS